MKISADLLQRIIKTAQSFGATRLILFGSALEQPANARDLDLACDGVDGWALYCLGARLEQEVGMPLDLVALSPRTPFVDIIEKKGQVLL